MNTTSEGTRSAQRLNKSMTGDPLNLHRVDGAYLEGSHARMVSCNFEDRQLNSADPEHDDDDDDHGMELLAGLLLTAILAVFVFGLYMLGR